jgi:hypothetical protein
MLGPNQRPLPYEGFTCCLLAINKPFSYHNPKRLFS